MTKILCTSLESRRGGGGGTTYTYIHIHIYILHIHIYIESLEMTKDGQLSE